MGGKDGKDANHREKNSWQKGSGEKGSKGQEKSGKGKPEHAGLEVKQDTLQRGVEKGGNNNLKAIYEDDNEKVEETSDNDEDLQAWSWLDESENEQ